MLTETKIPNQVVYETRTTVELITPEMAQEMLNGPRLVNRPISRARVLYWVAVMESGNYDLNVSTIDIDWNGGLTNGQHRLSAIIMRNKPWYLKIQRGVDPATIHKSDTGFNRTGGNSLAMEGFADANAVACTVRAIHMIHSNNLKLKMQNCDIAEWANQNREEIQYTVREWRLVSSPFYSYWYTALGFIYTHRLNEADVATKIREVLKSGVPSRTNGCPALAAREWTIQHHIKAHDPAKWAVLEIAARTFTYMDYGKSVKHFKTPTRWETAVPYFKLLPPFQLLP